MAATIGSKPFSQCLVLNKWMFSLFGKETFEDLASDLKDPDLEEFDENNISRFYHNLSNKAHSFPDLDVDLLRFYDENIVRHWQKITEKRSHTEHIFYPKYFQYLSLLFTEIYLDRYFRDPETLLKNLNAFVEEFNEEENKRDQIEAYELRDLNKLAFWSATGSGKTLMMHVNLLQFRHYHKKHRPHQDIDNILLLTPNEGLSRQHLEEFEASDIKAEIFSKEGPSLFSSKNQITILDIHKLEETSGDKTVAVEAFEGDNLLLVDEGHRGASGDVWMDRRNRLCEEGFSFEYSATFGEAASNDSQLAQEYARCILFDYSYRYFYNDGYGKDYRILNLKEDLYEESRNLYFVACLLTYYEQKLTYSEKKKEFRPFLLEDPLWIFVGSTVNPVYTSNKKKVSDVAEVMLHLSDFVQNKRETIDRIERVMSGNSGLLTANNKELFANSLQFLTKYQLNKKWEAQDIYQDVLSRVFNASVPAPLHIDNLKGITGEIGLRIGDNEYFGLVNVGDDAALCRFCEDFDTLVVDDKDFSESFFDNINDEDSTINILIGAKKFTEGWNSWRVSTMGLLNVGKDSGSSIIQLFGRGVRLKGYEFSLKRSSSIDIENLPDYIHILETLQIFGINADYMEKFREYLEDEGIQVLEEKEEINLPVRHHHNYEKKNLQTIRLEDDYNFKKDKKKGHLKIEVSNELKTIFKRSVFLDWYPKVMIQASKGAKNKKSEGVRHEAKLESKHLAFMDMDEIYFAINQYKNERAWHNLSIPRGSLPEILKFNNSYKWYELYIPEEEMEFTTFDKVRMWQEIAIALLKKFCDRFYKYKKSEAEADKLHYKKLDKDDPNMVKEDLGYRFRFESGTINSQQSNLYNKIVDLRNKINNGNMQGLSQSPLEILVYPFHLYNPLVCQTNGSVSVTPPALNKGEAKFVKDLQSYCNNSSQKKGESSFQNELLKDKELYLLRNQSRGRGIGFFEAGNFHPDFILWIIDQKQNKQYITFADPKGTLRLEGPKDPKIHFHKEIKQKEKDLQKKSGMKNIILNSFIISNTPHKQISWWKGGMTKSQAEDKHLLFQDDKDYIEKMVKKVLM